MTSSSNTGFDGVAAAIAEYLSVLSNPPNSDDVAIVRLIETLDGLVAAYHATQDVEPGDEQFEYPSRESLGGWTEPSVTFQRLPPYQCVPPHKEPDQQITLCDPANDLSEIADDMKTVAWLAENVSERDALWEFRFGFFNHWGWHLFSVRNYLQTHLTWPDWSSGANQSLGSGV